MIRFIIKVLVVGILMFIVFTAAQMRTEKILETIKKKSCEQACKI